jgi:hypothetical protein
LTSSFPECNCTCLPNYSGRTCQNGIELNSIIKRIHIHIAINVHSNRVYLNFVSSFYYLKIFQVNCTEDVECAVAGLNCLDQTLQLMCPARCGNPMCGSSTTTANGSIYYFIIFNFCCILFFLFVFTVYI